MGRRERLACLAHSLGKFEAMVSPVHGIPWGDSSKACVALRMEDWALKRGNILLIRAGSVGVRLAWTATMALAALRVLHTRGAMASRKGDPNLQVQEGV